MTIQLVDCSFFTGHYKMIAIDLSKLQLLHAGIEETDFTGNRFSLGIDFVNKGCQWNNWK